MVGEIGVLTGQPRTATCLAYEHPNDGSRPRTYVELVRLDRRAVDQLFQQWPPLRERVEELARSRLAEVEAASGEDLAVAPPAFQEEGLAQGQQLLLIDLDRCTRCGDCVRACVQTHQDGYARLFLDGPRVGSYLVAASCRQCIDPVCMIGCPVGAIHRGEHGQIVIEPWCIGCELCYRQCPYDAIQMHDRGLLPARSALWHVAPLRRAGGAEGSWTASRSATRGWLAWTGPLVWGLDLDAALRERYRDAWPVEPLGAVKDGLALAATFPAPPSSEAPAKLSITTAGFPCRVWVNGKALELEPVIRRKALVGYEATVPAERLQRQNYLAVAQELPDGKPLPVKAQETLFAARVDPIPPTFPAFSATSSSTEDIQVVAQLVEQRAVVCDLCAHLPTGPACVSSCPHDAAMRIDGRLGMEPRR